MTAQFPVRDYDLAATLNSGQAFRWHPSGDGWEGVIGSRWVRLRTGDGHLHAEVATPVEAWHWLEDYLGLREALAPILATFPPDAPLQDAVAHCRGLRLLRQDPWECLASFILSSTKRIVQIRHCVALLCDRFGPPLDGPAAATVGLRAFPGADRLATVPELELRACKLGFRARYLSAAARAVAAGELSLESLRTLPTPDARERLSTLPGVGPKIANCVLLFAYGRQDAFPVDVWVLRALRELYFPGKRPSPRRLLQFTQSHFGPYAGYAQQYLFHYIRTRPARKPRGIEGIPVPAPRASRGRTGSGRGRQDGD